jgi:hypothetical protein
MATGKNLDLLAICVWAAMTVIAVGRLEYQPLRLVLALPLLLLFAGHAMLRAFGPAASSRTEHLVYAIGLSVAAALMGGFLLNGISALTPLGWALWVQAVVAASTVIAMVRETMGGTQWLANDAFRLRGRHWATIGVSAVLVCGSYFLAISDEARQREFRYVEFWLVRGDGGDGELVVGIKNAEVAIRVFDVEVSRGGEVVAVWRSVHLEPGGTWTQPLNVQIDAGLERKIRARLYDHSDGKLYRQVTAIVPSV